MGTEACDGGAEHPRSRLAQEKESITTRSGICTLPPTETRDVCVSRAAPMIEPETEPLRSSPPQTRSDKSQLDFRRVGGALCQYSALPAGDSPRDGRRSRAWENRRGRPLVWGPVVCRARILPQ